MFKWIIRAFLALAVIVVVAGIANRDRLTRLLAVTSLFDEDKIVANFSNMPELFFSTAMPRGESAPSPLPTGDAMTLPIDYDAWVTDRSATAMVVLHKGTVVHEAYYLGTDAEHGRISWSVAKSYLSTLVGIAVDDGLIDLDAPAKQYAPDLAGTAYEKATVRNILNMSSGVVFDEDYLDFWSDINRMGRVLALGGSMDDFALSLDETFVEPGAQWQYVSIDTHVLGMVLRGATGRNVPDLLNEQILVPLALEQDAAYVTDGDGVAFVLGGLHMTTRDYARFGQMVLQGGQWQGQQIVSADWLRAATRASAPTAPGDIHYGYQWWIPADEDLDNPDHAFLGRGVYGQYLYIDPAREVVIAANGADRAFREDGAFDQNLATFRALAQAAAQ